MQPSCLSRSAIQCDELSREWELLLEKNDRVLAGALVAEDSDLSVADISRPELHGTASASDITTIATEWLKLDAQYLLPISRVNGVGKRTTIAMPYNWSPGIESLASSQVWEHERIPTEDGPEYLAKLSVLLSRVASVTTDISTEDRNPFAEIWDTQKLKEDLQSLPELRQPSTPPMKQELQDGPTSAQPTSSSTPGRFKDVIVSFTVYRADEKLSRPRQSVEVLGSQTLQQLQAALYCLHDLTAPQAEQGGASRGGDAGGGVGSAGSAGHGSGVRSATGGAVSPKDPPVMFINNAIYCQLCTPGDYAQRCACQTTPPAASSSSSGGRRTATAGSNLSAPVSTAEHLQSWLRNCCKKAPAAKKVMQNGKRGMTSGVMGDEAEVVLLQASAAQPAKKSKNAPAGSHPAAAAADAALRLLSNGATGTAVPTGAPGSSSTAVNATRRKLKAVASLPGRDSASPAGGGVVVPIVTVIDAEGPSAPGAPYALPLGHFALLREGVRRSGSTVPILCASSMRCDAIQWQLGTPYLYTHAGGCEHVLYLTNVQPCGGSEEGVDAAYPKETFRARVLQRRCDVCDTLSAAFMVYGDRLAETNPCLYCEHCYHMLHYSADGRLLYDDFQVFPYIHEA